MVSGRRWGLNTSRKMKKGPKVIEMEKGRDKHTHTHTIGEVRETLAER